MPPTMPTLHSPLAIFFSPELLQYHTLPTPTSTFNPNNHQQAEPDSREDESQSSQLQSQSQSQSNYADKVKVVTSRAKLAANSAAVGAAKSDAQQECRTNQSRNPLQSTLRTPRDITRRCCSRTVVSETLVLTHLAISENSMGIVLMLVYQIACTAKARQVDDDETERSLAHCHEQPSGFNKRTSQVCF
jgi:hypothetical protein